MNTAAQLREIRRMLLNVQHEIDDKLSDLMGATMDTEIENLANEVWDAIPQDEPEECEVKKDKSISLDDF